MTGLLPERLADLVTIAAFVLAADCAVGRGGLTAVNADQWRRDFHFVVPVNDLEFWSDPGVKRLLGKTLGFLSDDSYRFIFVQAEAGGGGRQLPISYGTDARTFLNWESADEVVLFSGGLDSLGGAIQESLLANKRVLLVSHESAPQIIKRQRYLADRLRERRGDSWPRRVGVTVTKGDKAFERESSQRSRSFLYVALAGAVAWLAGLRRVRFYENGIVALNLPMSRQLVGGRNTRTVHPKVLDGFSALLELVAGPGFKVENPFIFKTRAEVLELIRDAGCRDFIGDTYSCAHVRNRSRFCGTCSQCVDRQFSTRVAGVDEQDPDAKYDIALFRDPIPDNKAAFVNEYVKSAFEALRVRSLHELKTQSELAAALKALAAYTEESQETVGKMVVELHRRQAAGVTEQLRALMMAGGQKLMAGEEDPRSLLSRVSAQGLMQARQRSGLEGEETLLEREEQNGSTPGPGREAEHVTGAGAGAVPELVGTVEASEGERLLPVPGQTLRENTFLKSQHHGGWLVGLKGGPCQRVDHVDGMRLIHAALQHAGTRLSYAWLETSATEAENRDRLEESTGGLTKFSPLLRSVRPADGRIAQQIRDLKDAEEEANRVGQYERAQEHRAQREQLEQELLRSTGKRQKMSPEDQKVSSNARKKLDIALGRIGLLCEALKRHLQNNIKRRGGLEYQAVANWRLH
ncbi:MAG: 7-cyano-7-deazaguanine synthase [Alphaproteobacteria bacterium]|nr:7-cyano-7-deazaguanine synthase [Alphaproteobacteria bacterium]